MTELVGKVTRSIRRWLTPRAYHPEQVADLIVHLVRSGNGFRYLFPQELAEFAAQTDRKSVV